MTENNLSTRTIGIVFSLCALLSVSVIFLCSNLITKERLKKFSCSLLMSKVIILFLLFLLHGTGLNVIIKFLIMLDYVIDVEIYACIYPMITCITKKNKTYALRGLIYSYAYYGGILITSLLLGKTIASINIDFNIYCLIGSILMLVSYTIMKKTNLEKYYKNENEEKKDNNLALNKVLRIIKEDKISKKYLGFVLTGNISYNCLNGLLLTLLITNLGFSATGASNFKLILGIAAAFVGTLVLEKLTFKNDYVNFSIKFVGRFIFYLLALIFNNKFVFLVAIFYVRILAESYAHVSDAPYVNRFSNENQLAFCNLKEMINYLAKSIGNLLCGVAITMGTKYIFFFSMIFIIFQIIFGFQALNLRLKEKGEVNL